MIDSFVDSLGIPKACKLDRVVFKKLFMDNADLDATDKKALRDDVTKVRWLHTLKPSTINIQPFSDNDREFLEVAVLGVELVKPDRIKRIAALIHRAIPYPLLIVFGHGDDVAISVADKRINQVDRAKWVVEDVWLTGWFNPEKPNTVATAFISDCAVSTLPFTDFLAFYQAVRDRVIAFNAADRSGAYMLVSPEATENRIEHLESIDLLEREMAELKGKIRKTKQIAKQVQLNSEIKKKKDAIMEHETQLRS